MIKHIFCALILGIVTQLQQHSTITTSVHDQFQTALHPITDNFFVVSKPSNKCLNIPQHSSQSIIRTTLIWALCYLKQAEKIVSGEV